MVSTPLVCHGVRPSVDGLAASSCCSRSSDPMPPHLLQEGADRHTPARLFLSLAEPPCATRHPPRDTHLETPTMALSQASLEDDHRTLPRTLANAAPDEKPFLGTWTLPGR